jgi:hypothetical protein
MLANFLGVLLNASLKILLAQINCTKEFHCDSYTHARNIL